MQTRRFGPSPRKRVCLIAPKTPDNFWSMQATVDAVGAKALMPNNALATLLALTPPDVGLEYSYCDENVSPLPGDLSCDLVALTGFTLHAPRLRVLADTFRRRGIPVALGGAFATLDPDEARPLADHLFLGEAEYTWPRFLREWTAGKAQPVYEQTELVEMKDSPPPDWSFVHGGDYLYFTVQTSRGCPNRCDFCDVVRIHGRRHRPKPLDRVMTEIRNAHSAGTDTVFFADDNFCARPSFTRELLARMVEWNRDQASPLSFSCQASVAIADDDDLLRLLVDARMSAVFLGVESLRQACLEEVNKGHLFRPDLAERIRAMAGYGILPFIGFIVGFDHDDAATFDELERFLDETGSPVASISVLNAPRRTVLYERLTAQGRIRESFAGKWHDLTNIVPAAMPLEELLGRHRTLFRRLYEPARFEARAVAWLRQVTRFSAVYRNKRQNPAKLLKALHVAAYYLFRAAPPARRLFFRLVREAWRTDPRLIRKAITILTQYCHYDRFVNDPAWLAAGSDPVGT
jgi:radical SAM superfamily enzyme YgiQ (UPF0313 family)